MTSERLHMLQQMVLPPHPHRQHQMDSVGLKAKYMKLEWKKAAGVGGWGWEWGVDIRENLEEWD